MPTVHRHGGLTCGDYATADRFLKAALFHNRQGNRFRALGCIEVARSAVSDHFKLWKALDNAYEGLRFGSPRQRTEAWQAVYMVMLVCEGGGRW